MSVSLLFSLILDASFKHFSVVDILIFFEWSVFSNIEMWPCAFLRLAYQLFYTYTGNVRPALDPCHKGTRVNEQGHFDVLRRRTFNSEVLEKHYAL